VPPIDFQYDEHDWAEYLWEHNVEKWVKLPVINGPIPVPAYLEGLEFQVTGGKMLNCLEDVGCVVKLRVVDEWVMVTETNRRRFRLYLNGAKLTYRCRFTSHCPHWFNDVFYDQERVPSRYSFV